MGATITQIYYLGRRSVLRTIRQPAAIAPSIVFPLLLLTVTSGGLRSATKIPGFPAPSYLAFAVAGALVQGAMVGGLHSGADLAVDIENGFLNRLSITPMRRSALIFGQMAGAMVLGLLQGVIYLTYAVLAGVDIASGAGGAILLIVGAVLVSIVFSGFGALLGARTGSSEAVQGMFPLLFIILTLSSFFLPRNLITVGWFKTVATYNPITYMIEALRSLVITGFRARELLMGLGMALSLSALLILASSAALKSRLARA
ncbi:MAG: ABC transporter permease [Actinomycetota bacterium]